MWLMKIWLERLLIVYKFNTEEFYGGFCLKPIE